MLPTDEQLPRASKITRDFLNKAKPATVPVSSSKEEAKPKKQSKGSSSGNADRGGYAERMSPPAPPEVARQWSEERKYEPDEAAASLPYSERPRTIVELPEILEIAKQLNEGKTPMVKAKLGNALGRFSYRGEIGNIKLRADIFSKPGLAAKVLSHEIGHLVDWLPDKDIKRGNILGRIASLKEYMKHTLPEKPGAAGELTDADRSRLRRQAEKIIKDEKAVAGEDIGITPKDVLSIWNEVKGAERNKPLYDYIVKLSAAEKKQILKDAFKGEVNFALPTEEYRDWKAETRAKYQELIRQEIIKRKLYDYETVTNELKAVTQEWKPFNEKADPDYTKYRYSSVELYADAISVLFNEPELLRTKAPNFYRGFFNYIESKPAVKAVYDEIQDRLSNPENVGEQRLEGVYEMLQTGNKTRDEVNKRQGKGLSVGDVVYKYLIDKDYAVLKQIRKGKKQGGELKEQAQKAQYEIEETRYMAAEANDYVMTLDHGVMAPLTEAGLAVEDMGAYMLAKRAASDRATVANPRGLDEAAANRLINDLKLKLGAAKFKALEKAVEAYRKIREDIVIPKAEAASMYDDETIQMMKDKVNYARFNVLHHLEKKNGGQGTARIYKQVGTLSDIENPFIATVVQDISMMRAAKINTAKAATADFLKSIGEAKPADRVFSQDRGGMIAKEPADPDLALLSYLEDGKMESVYVDREIAKTFEKQPFEANKVAELFANFTKPIKEVLVSKNPVWMARNLVRDIKATVKNVPEVQFRDVPRLLRNYKQAFVETVQEVFKGQRSEDLAVMMKSYMLNPNRVYTGKDVTFENEIDRLVSEFQIRTIDHAKAKSVRGRLARAWDYLDKFGRVSELTGKLAGYKYLKENTQMSQEEIGHVVRTRIGTPDARRQGALHQLTNSAFMFSNIGKEGMRSAAEAFGTNRGRYIWKTAMLNILPKAIMVAAASGILAKLIPKDDAEELQRLFGKIPEFDKMMYDIIPLGINPEGKAIYLRIPQDYEGQFWGALTWLLSKGKITGQKGALDAVASQNPYNLNPLLKVGADLYTYYVRGLNPTDDYRGSPVIPRKAFIAGGWEAHKAMLKSSWKNLGGSVLYNPGDYSDRNASDFEKALKYPLLNVLGTFLKVSDKGEQEKFYDAEDEKERVRSERGIKIENRVIESIKQMNKIPSSVDIARVYLALKQEGILPKDETLAEFKAQRYFTYAAKAVPDSNLRMVLRARGVKARQEMLQEIKKNLSPGKYGRLVADLRRMGVKLN